ncbi:bifunctional ATP-dependent DNA helicase/ssDNA endodeoxyribonuclease DNA2 [Saccharomyces paradoxus]|uniref:DNA replication ATP-dependent helicase/nuclease DNA2 n=1 Tax=Saccharomyces paradoxus TaxID=27291 RepID=A0A8B8USU3_SACPA|nr:Dna2 [Saccharomyces paradoxus]QHS73800.1 Dna2 [Saccharomyces paradoxus]
MSGTPQKNKRSASISVSPVKKTEEKELNHNDSKMTLSKQAKRKKKYAFAPINNLNGKNSKISNAGVLKSISVSQVRNTSRTKEINKTVSKSAKPLSNSQVKLKREVSNLSRHHDFAHEEDGPVEEVIWKYSPLQRDMSDKTTSAAEYSDDYGDVQNPSSTPIVPNRLKTVLSFTNIHVPNADTNQFVQENEDGQVRPKLADISPRGSLRNIDDILDDIEGDLTIKPTMTKFSDLPSSPIKAPNVEQQPEVVVEAADNINTTGDSNDGDDSLIDILTQKYVEKRKDEVQMTTESNVNQRKRAQESCKEDEKIEMSKESNDNKNVDNQVKTENAFDKNQEDRIYQRTEENEEKEENPSDEFSDDSLIELLNETQTQAGSNAIEKEIDKVEKMVSNDLKVATDPALSTYALRAKFGAPRDGVVRLVIVSLRNVELPKIGTQKILECIDGKGEQSSVVVRHPWVYLEFEVGDVIHIIEGKNIENKRLLSDDKNPKTQLANDNLLVLNPDVLFSATSVGSSVGCLRRAILQMQFQDPRGEPSLVMTLGNIVHELLQDSIKYKLSHSKISMETIVQKLDFLLETYSFSIIICNEEIQYVKELIMKEHAENILYFVNKFVSKSNYGCYTSISGTRRTQPISISNVIDIEENIWSPIYGLKGFLDATVEANVENNKKHIVPLEVKTGKSRSVSYEVQGLIYTLLLNDRYEIPIDFFLLYFTRDDNMTKFPSVLHSIKHILMSRNRMSMSFKHQLQEVSGQAQSKFELPPLLRDSSCDSCFMKDSCMVLNKLLEDGTSEESGLIEGEFDILTQHLSQNLATYKEFFTKYNDLITKEESSVTCVNKELFLLDGSTRESRSGRCLSNLVVSEVVEHEKNEGTYVYCFSRRKNDSNSQSMLSSQIAANDFVIISDEEGHFCLCQGRVQFINLDKIGISVKRKLLNNRLLDKERGVTTIQSVVDSELDQSNLIATQNSVTYRIDKNDIQQSLSLARFNLLSLFLPAVSPGVDVIDEKSKLCRKTKRSDGGNEILRSLLVDNRAPKFRGVSDDPVIPYKLPEDIKLNLDQKEAIDKVMRAEDYALILGMPGTGKTTVIAEIIKILVSKGKRVLLTSYTHSAVDNILIKLKNTRISIMRLGMKHKVHPDAQKYVPNYASVKNYSDYLIKINSSSVIATTCLGINDILFALNEKDFDYVILDEASQISMPVALGPLRYGYRFIMVGDHYQLPPLVKNGAARLGGLEESLFKTFCEMHPESVVELTFQYRMCGDIVTLSNFLIYDNKLKCGNNEVFVQSLKLPMPEALSQFRDKSVNSKQWLEDILEPTRKVIFLDYDNCPDIMEQSEKDNITNHGEAELTLQCVEGMILSGVPCEDIGVMTLYRAQLRLLKKKFSKDVYEGLEILTADQFQGRDKKCIIISMVRRNSQLNGGALLRELRRVNVAMTRAKSKLIIIGSKSTIGSVPEIKSFVNLLEERNWVYTMCKDALYKYKFPDRSTATDEARKGFEKRTGAKPITSKSKFVSDKPIIKEVLQEYES